MTVMKFMHLPFGKKMDSASRTIPAITLQHALESHSIKHVDLLKIDCEGGEPSILLNTCLQIQ